ncbi:aldehyde dehydrogenase family protein [Rhodococcus qingshengii]|uniref:aldehyde dehydrogenase family protein n=1 Tax=Rhodococcus qingshengii TaxID=334542 RepID=UPI0022B59D56|nr:aldehyde dehydrogenase family protein [Rhodococcus qingshengii]MCZ4618725.1 aldehyde dehydrogenase family protein [Rhodococcus qingshengii]
MTFLDPNLWQGKINSNGWQTGKGGDLKVTEPATGAILGTLGLATSDDVRLAAERAAEAQVQWAQTPPSQRAAVLRRAAALWEENANEIAQWIVREAGSTRAKAKIEVEVAAAECWEASTLPLHPAGDVLSTDEKRWSIARHIPVGVVSVIAPFNFPLILSIRSVAPALALGNAVLLKPDPRTSVSGGVVLSRVFEEAGLPPGLLSLLPGHADVGEAVVVDPHVRVVSFTGSTAAGRRVGQTAAEHLKRAHLELGGNNALVVLQSADLEKAVSAGAFGSFMHQGQICMATGRHLVHASLYERYCAALADTAKNLPVGDPAQENVMLGPIIDQRQLDGIDAVVRASVDAGASVLAGGRPSGPFYPATVIADLDDKSPAWNNEIFGPVAPVRSFETLDEAAAIVNASEYGLAVGILGDVGEAMLLADRVAAGKVHINDQTVADEAQAPFGGTGASGTGTRFGGSRANIEAFTETQWVTVRPSIGDYPF